MPERVRVAQVVTRFIAGAGAVALHGALQLDPERYEVTVFSAEGDQLVERAAAAGIPFVKLRWMNHELAPTSDIRGVHELVGHLERGRFDLVHTHSAKAGAVGRLAARRVRTRAVVHTLHGLPFHQFQSWSRRRSYLAVEQQLGRLTHRFLAVGAAVAADAVRLGIARPERIVAIGTTVHGAIAPRTLATRRAARELLAVPPGMKVVGTVGRLDYQKAPEVLLDAFALLDRPDVLLVWVGDGPLRATVEHLTRVHRLEERVRFLGNRTDVPALLPGFDLFALPSRYEGMPCAIAEAMTCGVPVVATAVNSVPEMVLAGRTGLLVPPERPAALASALAHLLDHPGQAGQLALEATAHLADSCSPETLGRTVTAAYEHALAMTAPAPVRERAGQLIELRGRRARRRPPLPALTAPPTAPAAARGVR
jgi:glycosyltransferase involved in cell wall biosynthesis